MKKTLLFLVLLVSTFAFSQEYKKLRLESDGQVKIIKDAFIDLSTNQINYTNAIGENTTLDLSEFDKIQYQKGSRWLGGMIGGMGGVFLGSLISGGDDNQEWWYGLGPRLLIGAGIGAGVGALFPKYKNLELGENVTVEVGLNSVRITF